jgi:hypothetical protein
MPAAGCRKKEGTIVEASTIIPLAGFFPIARRRSLFRHQCFVITRLEGSNILTLTCHFSSHSGVVSYSFSKSSFCDVVQRSQNNDVMCCVSFVLCGIRAFCNPKLLSSVYHYLIGFFWAELWSYSYS